MEQLLDPFKYFSATRALAEMPFLITRVVLRMHLKSQSSTWKWERRLPNVTGRSQSQYLDISDGFYFLSLIAKNGLPLILTFCSMLRYSTHSGTGN